MPKKKDNSTLNKSIDKLRITILTVLFGVVILIFLLKLVEIQVADHDLYAEKVVTNTYKQETLQMSRGHIYDRNGKVLASNKKIYNISVDYATLDSKDYNTALLRFIDFCYSNDIELADKLPVSQNAPYEFDDDYIFDADREKKFDEFIKVNELDENKLRETETAFYEYLCKRYDIDKENSNKSEYRKLAGLRYDMETNSFSYFGTYALLSDVSEDVKTKFAEVAHTMHGIKITTTDKRYYNEGSLASHILGSLRPIFADDKKYYIDEKGYSYDALIGREGVELAFEEYLHGYDEIIEYEVDENNNIVDKRVVREGQNGYSVKLTIDAELQAAAEKALQEQIEFARRIGLSDTIPYNGEDCRSGAVVVMNPKTGEVYVSASYPNYDLNTYLLEDEYERLKNDKGEPFINRATTGLYQPGSTFKIATSIAGLLEGVITPETLIYDKGEYRAYEDYHPRCWIYVNTGGTHGYMNVKSAIENSCNYFFYEIGDKMGIDKIIKYASLLGLGELTGIEVPEYKGVLASPETRNNRGEIWNPGDTLQAAIGQSDNLFTPIQLCSYMSTIINGGTRYKATLLDSVEDFYTGEIIVKNNPEVLSTVGLPQSTVELLKSAMKSVVEDGTARTVFSGYDYDVGGKTGTAQVGSKQSDTALFVGFAPYDDPEIVVSVVVANGDKSARASEVAREIFDCYFGIGDYENKDGADE